MKLQTEVKYFNDGSLVMLCNLKNIEPNTTIKYCRFSRNSDSYSLHMSEAQGVNKYIYYGSGFINGDCGMIISTPAKLDKSLWKCFIGIETVIESEKTWKKENKYIKRTFGAIIDATTPEITTPYFNGENVYNILGKPLNVLCESEIALHYCWLSDPKGNIYTVTDELIDPNRTYTYYGNGLLLGHCGVAMNKSTMDHNGKWTCNVGYMNKPQLEKSITLEVRITDTNLAASVSYIHSKEGESVTLECFTIPPNVPLEYCRFLSPNGDSFSIDETITSKNAIMDKYYFNSKYNLNSGYCAIVIKTAEPSHSGQWTCGGRLKGWKEDSFDRIEVEIGNENLL